MSITLRERSIYGYIIIYMIVILFRQNLLSPNFILVLLCSRKSATIIFMNICGVILITIYLLMYRNFADVYQAFPEIWPYRDHKPQTEISGFAGIGQ